MINKFAQSISVAVLAFTLATPTFAAQKDFAQCREFFADNTPPVVQNQEGLKSRALCFSSFAVMHSGKSHTPLYVAERLNREVLSDAKHKNAPTNFLLMLAFLVLNVPN